MAEPINSQKRAYIADVNRRLAGYFIDSFVSVIILSVVVYIVLLFLPVSVSNQLAKSAMASASSNALLALQVEFLFAYVFTLAIYYVATLFFFNKTLGMFIVNTVYMTSNHLGDPVPIKTPQKFMRGFFGGLFSLFILPIVALPFDKYRRSIIDRLSGTFVFQLDDTKLRTMISYAVIFIVLVFYLVLAFK